MTKIQPNNEVPEPMKRGANTPSTADKKSAGGRMPQSGPGRTQSDDDMKHKQRSGGDAGRDEADDEDNRRGGQHTQQETDEDSGKSRQGGHSRNM